ncbi:hypothetical protein J1N35_035108 [Gossypium stocksii]|uniref:Retrotransposon gag domain-containing protein n=1 Tax=Gossypium stocksii TaxID=47602 RepID=A0A9D3UTF6_9ROSI|nr:hypothetical protein J1N35_035108 [Gossypium stocksii]
MQRQRQLAGWDHLIEAIRKTFTLTKIESSKGQLTKLTQTTTVAEYQTHFEDLVLHTTNLTEVFLTQCFISGLRSDIKNEVLFNRVASMSEAMTFARFHDARLNDMKRLMGRDVGPKTAPLLPNPLISPTSPHNIPGQPPPIDQLSKAPNLAFPQPR